MQKRGKQTEKNKAHVKSLDFYRFYSIMHFKGYNEERKRVLIDRDSPYYVDYSTYNKILSDFNIALRDEILYNAFEFIMPYRMGTLSIRKKKLTPWINEEGKLVNPFPPDWKATMDLWEADPISRKQKKLVRHTNTHTQGYVAKWYYSTRNATFKWKSAYGFMPCRTAKVLLSQALKDPESSVDYYKR